MKTRIVLVLVLSIVMMTMMTGLASAEAYGEATVIVQPVATDTSIVGSVSSGGSGGSGSTDGGYESVSIAIPDPGTSVVSDAVTTVVGMTVVGTYVPINIGDEVSAICYGGSCEAVYAPYVWEVQPPEVWIPESPPDVWEVQPPEAWIPERPPVCVGIGCAYPPPDVGTCEYPGHPPCTPYGIPDVWIMPQWFQWSFT